jgi:hypothetical protein
LALAIVAVLLTQVSSCAENNKGKKTTAEAKQTSLFRGDQNHSPSRKASEERPRPEVDNDRPPFESDRTLIGRHEQRKREEHAALHRKLLGVVGAGPLHPACLQLKGRVACPLLRYRWTLTNTSDGLELRVNLSREEAAVIRDSIHCHRTLVQSHGATFCPFQSQAVRASVWYRKGQAVISIVVVVKNQVERVRETVRQLVQQAQPGK